MASNTTAVWTGNQFPSIAWRCACSLYPFHCWTLTLPGRVFYVRSPEPLAHAPLVPLSSFAHHAWVAGWVASIFQLLGWVFCCLCWCWIPCSPYRSACFEGSLSCCRVASSTSPNVQFPVRNRRPCSAVHWFEYDVDSEWHSLIDCCGRSFLQRWITLSCTCFGRRAGWHTQEVASIRTCIDLALLLVLGCQWSHGCVWLIVVVFGSTLTAASAFRTAVWLPWSYGDLPRTSVFRIAHPAGMYTSLLYAE